MANKNNTNIQFPPLAWKTDGKRWTYVKLSPPSKTGPGQRGPVPQRLQLQSAVLMRPS